MKATGIVRRIDDLGRIVIPKEIRRTLRIRETDPLEIFTENSGEIILKKYSPIGELAVFAKEYAESLTQTTGQIVCVSDREQVIAAAGNVKKELMEKSISKELEEFMENREALVALSGENNYIKISDEIDMNFYAEAICPIICEGNVLGNVIMLARNEKVKFTQTEKMLVCVAADFIGKQMVS